MINHGFSEEYIQLLEQTYDEAYIEKEEKQIKEDHIRLDNKYDAYVGLLDEIIKQKDIVRLNGFVNLVDTQLRKEVATLCDEMPEKVQYILQFLEVYVDEYNDNKCCLIYQVESFEDFMDIMVDVRFMMWRVDYLGESFDELKAYVQRRKLSYHLLRKAVKYACVQEDRVREILEILAVNNED